MARPALRGTAPALVLLAAVAFWVTFSPGVTRAEDSLPIPEAGPNRTAYAGEAVWLNGSAVDDGHVVRYEWDFDGDGTFDWSSPTSGSAGTVYASTGTFTAVFRVTDNSSLSAEDTTVVTVRARNKAPRAEAGPDLVGEVGRPVAFAGSGHDPDGSMARYEWDFDGDGRWDLSGPDGHGSHEYAQAGEYTALLKVTDAGSPPLSGTDACLVTIHPQNTPPSANAGPSLTVTAGDPVVLVGKGLDPDGTLVLYEWDFEGDGRVDWESNTTGTATARYFEPGTYQARLRVTDSGPVRASDTSTTAVSVVRKNSPPVVVGPSNLTGLKGKPVRFSVLAVDPDAGDGIRKVAWDFDANGVVDFYSSSLGANHTFNSTGTFTVRATAFDGAGANATWSMQVRVTEDKAEERNLLSVLLPPLLMVLLGIALGAGVAFPATVAHVKRHWDRYYRPARYQGMKAREELEDADESSFRGLPPGPPGGYDGMT